MVEHGMRYELLTTRLYDAAFEGDVPSLLNVLREDPLILDRCSIEKTRRFMRSPLHVAAYLGHLEFTTEILRRKPDLAEELDHSQRSSPLHLSSAKGHLEIIKALVAVRPEMCLAQDRNGNNPVHLAAIRGHIYVLEVLLQAMPQAAREWTNGGETVLHLCIKYSQPETLKFLVNVIGDLLNSRDSNGNTVLHLAVANKQPETVKFLLGKKRMHKNAINTSGLTAMDTFNQSRKGLSNREIWLDLKYAKALRAKDALKPRSRLADQRSALIVVASLIATMAFQVGINPPGGVWQDDADGHKAGFSIMADKDIIQFDKLRNFNTVGLVSSLSVILLLISGLPFNRLFVIILTITMWVAITGTTLTYLLSLNFLTFPTPKSAGVTLAIVVLAWLSIMTLLLVGHVLLLMVKLIKKLVFLVIKLYRWFCRS